MGSPTEAVKLMQERLTAWLDKPEAEAGQLVRWLEGYDLPAEHPYEEPYLWLLRGLPLGRERHNYASALSVHLAALLDEQPDVRPRGRRPERLLYNLLSLCGALDYPDQLAGPLNDMLVRGRLAGEWEGSDLRRTLLWALITNQVDARHKERWEKMLQGIPDGFLGGTPVEGYRGILRCPSAGRGVPDCDAIGSGLKQMALCFENDSDRRLKFDDLLAQTKSAYPGLDWDYRLILAGTKNGWPIWAAERLILVARAPHDGKPGIPYILPSPIAELAKGTLQATNGDFYLHELAQKVVLTGEAVNLVLPLAWPFDSRRRQALEIADTNSPRVIAELLVYPEMVCRGTGGPTSQILATAMRGARESMLAKSGIPFNRAASPFSA